jgi:inorganic pyrophosphatase
MRDDKGDDDKIVAVAVDDPAFNHYTEATQLPPHVMIELERFFRDYKILEAKSTEVNQIYDRQQALSVVRQSLDAYRARSAWRKP